MLVSVSRVNFKSLNPKIRGYYLFGVPDIIIHTLRFSHWVRVVTKKNIINSFKTNLILML